MPLGRESLCIYKACIISARLPFQDCNKNLLKQHMRGCYSKVHFDSTNEICGRQCRNYLQATKTWVFVLYLLTSQHILFIPKYLPSFSRLRELLLKTEDDKNIVCLIFCAQRLKFKVWYNSYGTLPPPPKHYIKQSLKFFQQLKFSASIFQLSLSFFLKE